MKASAQKSDEWKLLISLRTRAGTGRTERVAQLILLILLLLPAPKLWLRPRRMSCCCHVVVDPINPLDCSSSSSRARANRSHRMTPERTDARTHGHTDSRTVGRSAGRSSMEVDSLRSPTVDPINLGSSLSLRCSQQLRRRRRRQQQIDDLIGAADCTLGGGQQLRVEPRAVQFECPPRRSRTKVARSIRLSCDL